MDIERAIEFILGNQVKFSEGLVQIEAKHAALEATLGRVVGLCESIVAVQAEQAQQMKDLTGKIDRLTESQQSTDRRLDALIAVVDDIVRRKPQ